MGARRRHAVEHDPEAVQRRPVVQRSEEQGNGVLELQRSAGNRAVAERIEVARDKSGDGPPNARKDRTLTLKGLSGPMTIISYTFGGKNDGNTGGTGGSSDRETGKPEIRELTLTAKFDALGQEVYRAHIAGQSLGDGDLETGYMTLHLTDVYVSSAQLSGGDKDQTITFTLNVGSLEFKAPELSDKPTATPDAGEKVNWGLESPAGG